ncbi:unnamed protein product [Bathycoccus prasinos]
MSMMTAAPVERRCELSNKVINASRDNETSSSESNDFMSESNNGINDTIPPTTVLHREKPRLEACAAACVACLPCGETNIKLLRNPGVFVLGYRL